MITAETLLSFLHIDQFISPVRIEICSVYLLSVELAADLPTCFLQMAEGIPAADWLVA